VNPFFAGFSISLLSHPLSAFSSSIKQKGAGAQDDKKLFHQLFFSIIPEKQ
jgi:hypothetical protein